MAREWVCSVLVLSLLGALCGNLRLSAADAAASSKHEAPAVMEIVLDPKAVACGRFLGFGAEWDPNFWADFNLELGVTERDWQLVVERLRWMRMPIVRMMMQAKWCTPKGDGRFDWHTQNMESLYRHLDVCQQLGITVILTDWAVATWAKVPGFAGNDDPKYAEAIGVYMDYLLNRKGYSCIKYFILMNEPNFERGSWEKWKKGVENVAKVFARRGLDRKVIFVGSDESGDEGWHRRAVVELWYVFGAYDVHRYARDRLVRWGWLEQFFRRHWDYVLAKDPQAEGKPFIVGEAGMQDGAVHPRGNKNIETFEYGLFMADYAVQAARAGSGTVIAWMLDDSSHKGFFWGLWSDKRGGFKLRPWFYPWSLLCRYVPRGAVILRPEQPSRDLRLLAARAPDGWTFCLVNRGGAALRVRLKVPGEGEARFKRFLYVRELLETDADGFPVAASQSDADLDAGVRITCPAESVVLLTSLPW